MPRKIFVKVQWEFPTAGHLVFWKPCPWVKIPKKMLCASTKNSCTSKILKPSFENRLRFMPTNIKCLGKVWTILLWITWELVNHFTLSVSELEYFWSVDENFTLCPGSTVAPSSSPKQYLKSLEFSKQLPDVFTQIQWDISCKLDVNFRLPGI